MTVHPTTTHSMAQTDPPKLPDDYNAENVLGALTRAVVDRYLPGTYTEAQVANAIADQLGGGDYATAEDNLWHEIGEIVDTIDDALQRHLKSAAAPA